MNTGNCPDTEQIQNIGLTLSDLNRSAKTLNTKRGLTAVFRSTTFVSFPKRVILLFALPDVKCNLFQEQFIRDLIDYYRMVKRWKNVKSNEKASRHVKTS